MRSLYNMIYYIYNIIKYTQYTILYICILSLLQVIYIIYTHLPKLCPFQYYYTVVPRIILYETITEFRIRNIILFWNLKVLLYLCFSHAWNRDVRMQVEMSCRSSYIYIYEIWLLNCMIKYYNKTNDIIK